MRLGLTVIIFIHLNFRFEGEAKPYVEEPKPYKPPHRPVHLAPAYPAPYHEPAPPAYPYAN